MFEKYGGYKTGKLKLKKPKQLQVGATDDVGTLQPNFYLLDVFIQSANVRPCSLRV